VTSELSAFRVRLPLRTAHLAAHGTESVRDVILVRCVDTDANGAETEGWGECPTLSSAGYVDETTDSAWAALTVGGAVGATAGPMARAAVADSRLDARLRARGVSLAEHLGATATAVDRTVVLGLDAEVPADATSIKVKVTPATIGRLRDLRQAWPDLSLAADANGSFGSADEVPAWIDELALRYFEQPLGATDLAGHHELRQRTGTRIALDESILGPDDLAAAIDAAALDVVSLKPARLGGLEVARGCLDLAIAAGLGAFVGGMLETGIGRAGALALAACDGLTEPTDLGPSAQYFAQDLCEPLVLDELGRVVVPTDIGIGRHPDPLLLVRHVVDFAPIV